MSARPRTLLLSGIAAAVLCALATYLFQVFGSELPAPASTFLPLLPGGIACLAVATLGLRALNGARGAADVAKAQFQGLLQTCPDAVVLINDKRHILLANSAAEKLFGSTAPELAGRLIDELISEPFQALFGDGSVPPFELPERSHENEMMAVRRKDGDVVPVDIFLRTIETPTGDLFAVILRDKTERLKVEASLRAAEAKYRGIFENAAEGIFQVTPQGRFLTANRALARMLGYHTADELIASVPDIKKIFVEPGKRSEIRRLVDLSGAAKGFEYHAYRKDGTKIWLLGNQRVVRDDANQVLYYEGNFEEITERKRAEDALRESQRALLTLMSNLPGTAYRCRNDRDRTTEFLSEGAFTLTGHAPSAFTTGKVKYAELIHPDDRKTVWDEVQNALREDRPFQMQYRLHLANREKTVWEQGQGVRGPDGGLLLEGLILDVTERVRAQENLRKSEERFRQLSEHIHGIVWMTDPPMRELFYVNSAYERIWGGNRAALFKNPRARLEAVDPSDLPRVLDAIDQAAVKGYDLEYRIVRPDGTVRWVWDRAFPIADDKGQVYRLAGIAEDVTDHKRLEEELLQAQKMEAVGRLAGGIAHDFNNLLTVINGYSEMMLLELKPENPSHACALQINKAGDRAAALTRQLLAFSRKQMLMPEVIDLNRLVNSVRDMVQRLIGEHIEFALHLAATLGPVEADPGQVEQVLLNLVVNARDAMPQGGKLTVETADVELSETECQTLNLAPGSYVLLCVRDTGVGMDVRTRGQIFEPFFTTKELGKGTGLGLSMVYGIVRQSGGSVAVESEPGEGTTFRIYLPRFAGRPSRPAATAPARGRAPGSETVLLVEDEEMVRSMTRKILQNAGYTVLEAADGAAALARAAAHPGAIDLLISDMIMPNMNGRALYQKLLESRPGLSVLFMSGYTDSALLRHGILDDNLTVLLKPFTQEDFLRHVREMLDQQAPVLSAHTTETA